MTALKLYVGDRGSLPQPLEIHLQKQLPTQVYLGKSAASGANLRKVSSQVGASNLCFDSAIFWSQRTYSDLVGICVVIHLYMQLSASLNTASFQLSGSLFMTQLLTANNI